MSDDVKLDDVGRRERESVEAFAARRDDIRAKSIERGRQYRLYMRTSARGLEVGLSLVVGAVLGHGVDVWFDCKPWGVLLGFFFGAATSARFIMQMVKEQKALGEKERALEAATQANKDIP
jgi:F0F1-type ATP synthase assembly protein I